MALSTRRSARRAARTSAALRHLVEHLESRCLLSAVAEPVSLAMGSFPTQLAQDPSGDLWVLVPGDPNVSVDKIDPASGQVVGQYPMPYGQLSDIVYANGYLYASSINDGVVKFDTAGQVVQTWDLPGASPTQITAGPNGDVYFVQRGTAGLNAGIGILHADNSYGLIPLNVDAYTTPSGVAVDQAGTVYYTLTGSTNWTDTGDAFQTPSYFGRIGADGVAHAQLIPTPDAVAGRPLVAPNGSVWFLEGSSMLTTVNAVVRATDNGDNTFTFAENALAPDAIYGDQGFASMAASADGTLWITESYLSAVAAFDPSSGSFTQLPTPTEGAGAWGIVAGDMGVWFTEPNIDRVALIAQGATSGAVVGTGRNITLIAGQPFSGTVASFTARNVDVAGLSATIAWGDGQTSAGTIVQAADGSYEVVGSGSYAAAGSYGITVTLSGAGLSAPVLIDASADVRAGLIAQGTVGTTLEDVAFTSVVATFSGPSGTYTASIDWGNGTVSAGTVALVDGVYQVIGTVTYANEGRYQPTVTITGQDVSATVTGVVTVTDTPLQVYGLTVTPLANKLVNGTVAFFTDDLDAAAGQYAAQINWGDGTSGSGTVVADASTPGRFLVLGTHKYKKHATYSITTTISYLGATPESALSNYTAVSTVTV